MLGQKLRLVRGESKHSIQRTAVGRSSEKVTPWTQLEVFTEAKLRVEKYWESESLTPRMESQAACLFSTSPCLFLVSQFQCKVLTTQNLILLLGIYCFLEFIASICFFQFLELPVGTHIQFKVQGWERIASYKIENNKIGLYFTPYKN